MNRDRLKTQLRVDEGVRNKPYTDTVGKLTIGVGHNLTDKGISDKIVDLLLDDDIDEVIAQADHLFPWWKGMSDVRQEAFLNWLFNVGIGKAQLFVNTLKAFKDSRWADAAQGLQDSLWYQQVGKRAQRIVDAVRQG